MTDARRPPKFTDADASYAAIVDALDAAGDSGTIDFLTRLVLLLAAEVGDHARIVALVTRAGQGPESTEPGR